ncbi:hypothetical protein HHK36_020069 [Tetracentron sinense]|uniref:BHLH domain-containing protein n=1 Tax=Tetracentron sinense TaxID=13715 RepID=A0A835D8H9_TETSI|nr:hypothetical protein HHK36_020069 [Tetracentron sinense]
MTEHKRRPVSIDHGSLTCEATKRHKTDVSLSTKERKEQVGERIVALQQLVSPFGKTDTASVLSEAVDYIKFLQDQVKSKCWVNASLAQTAPGVLYGVECSISPGYTNSENAGLVDSRTLESDTQALRSLKQSIDPNSISKFSFLDSWDFKIDPCESSGSHFLGILCTIPLDNSRSRVSVIDLDGIGYEGFLTPAIGNLTELTTINLSKNRFRGPIPETISNLRKLTRLIISENFFTGIPPIEIWRLGKLEFIDMSQNKLSGSIPRTLSGLRSLTHLSLSNNEFSGRIPDLTGLWQLATLELSGNQLSGIIPKLPINLRTLSLSRNFLSGHTSSIGKLQDLEELDLSDNRFSGVIQEILTLPRVIRLNISVNRFTVLEVVKFSGRATQLEVLDVHGNHLQGHLPVNLVTVENLRTINLGHNQFTGPIPAGYGEKVGESWKSLFLDYNYLVGRVPPQFSTEASRTQGSLANNCLSCPVNLPMCRGGQRPASECGGRNGQ